MMLFKLDAVLFYDLLSIIIKEIVVRNLMRFRIRN